MIKNKLTISLLPYPSIFSFFPFPNNLSLNVLDELKRSRQGHYRIGKSTELEYKEGKTTQKSGQLSPAGQAGGRYLHCPMEEQHSVGDQRYSQEGIHPRRQLGGRDEKLVTIGDKSKK
jgi:hypothetical protein